MQDILQKSAFLHAQKTPREEVTRKSSHILELDLDFVRGLLSEFSFPTGQQKAPHREGVGLFVGAPAETLNSTALRAL